MIDRQAFRSAVVRDLRSMVGVKFTHQGRSPEQGFDCLGLPLFCLRANGHWMRLESEDLRPCYRRWPNPDDLLGMMAFECQRMDLSPDSPHLADYLERLDVILVDYECSGAPRHLLTVTEVQGDNILVIQTHKTWGDVREHTYTAEWKMMTHSFWRLKSLV